MNTSSSTTTTSTSLVRAARAAHEDGYSLQDLIRDDVENRTRAAHYLLNGGLVPEQVADLLGNGAVAYRGGVLVEVESCGIELSASAVAEALENPDPVERIEELIRSGIASVNLDYDNTLYGEVNISYATPDAWRVGRCIEASYSFTGYGILPCPANKNGETQAQLLADLRGEQVTVASAVDTHMWSMMKEVGACGKTYTFFACRRCGRRVCVIDRRDAPDPYQPLLEVDDVAEE